jgi:hypothetical protein
MAAMVLLTAAGFARGGTLRGAGSRLRTSAGGCLANGNACANQQDGCRTKYVLHLCSFTSFLEMPGASLRTAATDLSAAAPILQHFAAQLPSSVRISDMPRLVHEQASAHIAMRFFPGSLRPAEAGKGGR